MPAIDLYYMEASPPCRSVMMTAKLVGVELNLKKLDLMANEHMKPEFLKINPQHNIPTIDDNGFYLNESRAICAYLVNKYGKNDTLYPKDAAARALVDQRLYFDMTRLLPSLQPSLRNDSPLLARYSILILCIFRECSTQSCLREPPSLMRKLKKS